MEKKLTAMMQLREKLQHVLNENTHGGEFVEGYNSALKNIIADIKVNMLPIEREMIEESYRKGVEDERYDRLDFIHNSYYTETFKTE